MRRSIPHTIRKLLVPPAKMTLQTHQWMLGMMRRPVPVPYWQIFRRTIALFSARPDALSPSLDSIITNGSALPIPELQSILADDELGDWSLDGATIVRLWALLRGTLGTSRWAGSKVRLHQPRDSAEAGTTA